MLKFPNCLPLTHLHVGGVLLSVWISDLFRTVWLYKKLEDLYVFQEVCAREKGVSQGKGVSACNPFPVYVNLYRADRLEQKGVYRFIGGKICKHLKLWFICCITDIDHV